MTVIMSNIPEIEFKNVTKIFGSLIANNKISFSVKKGTIRALVGENGAGKSTAMKILFGLYKEDSGEILVRGKPQHWRSPRDAIQNGIGMVHQHFMLAETATGLDNIIIGDEEESLLFPFLPVPFNFIDRRKARLKIEALANKYGLTVPLNVKISKLPVGMQQRIEILKLLYRNANILILDEPTAVLTPKEVDDLFKNLKKLKDEGKTIIIVTHKLREVLNFSDDITVFRNGTVAGHLKTDEATNEKIAALMVGRNINLKPQIPFCNNIGKAVLEFKNVSLKNESKKKLDKKLLTQINLKIHSGEIVGIAAVEGNGQTELLKLIVNPKKYFGQKNSKNNRAKGQLLYKNNDISHKNNTDISLLKIGFIPEDRHADGLLLNMSAKENFILGRHWEKIFCNFFLQNTKKIDRTFSLEMEKFDIRPRSPNTIASGFSGGNQQKLIISREFGKNPDLIVAANPTRGVDIGAIEFIHSEIVKERDSGKAILLISSELDEITTLSDRIIVMYEGKIVAEYTRGETTDYQIGLAMCGGNPMSGGVK